MSKAAPLSFDFALEGFRIIRERPKLIAFWGALCVLGNGLVNVVIIRMAGPGFVNWLNLQGKTVDQAQMMAATAPLMPALGVSLLINIIMNAVLSAAVFRASLGEAKDTFGFLKFGRNELNLIIVSLAMFVVMFGIMVGCGAVAGLLGVLFSALSPLAPEAFSDVSILFALLAIAFMLVRLSLNMAQTFATGRINIFGSYALTRDVFWSLVKGYALAGALAVVVFYLAATVVKAVLVVGFQGVPTEAAVIASLSSLTSFFSPYNIVMYVMIYGGLMPLLLAIVIGAPMAAYKVLGGDNAELKPEKA